MAAPSRVILCGEVKEHEEEGAVRCGGARRLSLPRMELTREAEERDGLPKGPHALQLSVMSLRGKEEGGWGH